MRKFAYVLFVVALVLAWSATAQAALITNGDFQSPTTNWYDAYDVGSTTITGWTVGTDTGGVSLMASGLSSPSNGTQILQLGWSTQMDVGSIYQDLTTVSGELYTISLQGAIRTGDGGTNGVTATFGSSSATFTPSQAGWQSYSFNATASSGTTQLTLSSLSTGQYKRFYIDNVSVNPVPEPSTLILLVMAALGLLAYAWRKRRS